MNKLNLCLHTGAYHTTREQIEKALVPEPSDTWTPIPHHEFIRGVAETIGRSGLSVVAEEHALAREGLRYFGMLQIANGENGDGDYGLVVGLRNSHDKSFPAGLVVGSGVFVCDNLAFSGEIKLARKHTVHIRRDLPQLIETAFGKLADFRQRQHLRLEAYQNAELTDTRAHDLIVQSVDVQALPLTRIPSVLQEWRNPRHPEFAKDGKTGWRLFNAFTEALKGTEPNLMMRRTMTLHGLMDSACGVLKNVPARVVATAV